MKTKRSQAFSNKLLKVLIVGGVVTVAAINPFFGLLTAKVIEEELKKKKWKEVQDNLHYLKRKGYINTRLNSDGSYTVKPTVKGQNQAKKHFLNDTSIKVPKKWDRNWRLVVFDIPVAKQKARLAFLARLKGFGFVMLQKSIWAYPFECKNEITTVAKIFEVEDHIHHVTCREISAGDFLFQEFEKRNNVKLV